MIARLRDATLQDAALIFGWANEPATRAASFSSAPIAWDTHVAWLTAGLSDSARFRLFVAEDASGTPIAQVRFERAGPTATISYSIAADHRRRGLATALILYALERVSEAWRSVDAYRAEVKPENLASARALSRAGFWLDDSMEGKHVYLRSTSRESLG